VRTVIIGSATVVTRARQNKEEKRALHLAVKRVLFLLGSVSFFINM